MNTIDFQPFLDHVVFPTITLILSGVVPPIAIWAVIKVGQVAHISLTSTQAARLEQIMQNGVTLVLGRAQGAVDAHASVEVNSKLVADAVDYVLPKAQSEMAALGITPESMAERVEARILARVPNVPPAQVAPVAAAPVVAT